MSENVFYISKLIQKKLQMDLSENEEAELAAWLAASELNRSIYANLNNGGWVKRELEKFENYDQAGRKDAITRLATKSFEDGLSVLPEETEGLLVDSRKRFGWKHWVAAASVILAIGISGYFIYFNKPVTSNQQLISGDQPKDLPPGRDAAILTLADGRKVVLDSTSGTITNANGIQIINVSGLLSYQGESETAEMIYNTITTARGNQYQLQLEDGTKVWLNSASSLRYPVAFKGKDRIVEMTGEGYFEVAQDKSRPFHVSVGDIDVEVLGTHFNVNSYKDEESITTTLLEGSVKVSMDNGQQSTVIKPGQQARMIADNRLSAVDGIDLEKVIAWKTGWFEFDQMDLGAIMRQVSRWYDVDIEYDGKLTDAKYFGRISKNLSLSNVLTMLESNGPRFRLQGKTLIVKP